MATPNLTTEVTAVPQFPLAVPTKFNLKQVFFEDDSSQSFLGATTKHRDFVLKYVNQSNSEKASFEAFHDARMADGAVFYWNNGRTGEVDIKVRFVEAEVDYEAATPVTWQWTVTLRKVIS